MTVCVSLSPSSISLSENTHDRILFPFRIQGSLYIPQSFANAIVVLYRICPFNILHLSLPTLPYGADLSLNKYQQESPASSFPSTPLLDALQDLILSPLTPLTREVGDSSVVH